MRRIAGRGTQVDSLLIGVSRRPEEGSRFAVEGGLEVALGVDEQEPGHDHEAGDADPEADLLDSRVRLHSKRDHHAHESQDDQTGHEDAGLAVEVCRQVVQAQRVGKRLEELDVQDVGVDRRPEEQREPPSGDREDETKGASEDAALPRIVAAGTWHHADQHGVRDHEERRQNAEDNNRGQQLPVGDPVHERHAVKAERDQVHRPERIDESIE